MQAMSAKRKSLNEEFVKFFENPTREGLRALLKNNFGELPNLDFKEDSILFIQRRILKIS
jgi:hypothetical protein